MTIKQIHLVEKTRVLPFRANCPTRISTRDHYVIIIPSTRVFAK